MILTPGHTRPVDPSNFNVFQIYERVHPQKTKCKKEAFTSLRMLFTFLSPQGTVMIDGRLTGPIPIGVLFVFAGSYDTRAFELRDSVYDRLTGIDFATIDLFVFGFFLVRF